ncbi:membrane protein YqaA with SNARE-associated domain [Nocardiopsis sp. Huas11]|uniref:hypothetical protein n=1 Tax=Nocardiopsis sp. Huas11 TaxID=2183912 RepID=UPI000EAEFFCD|nr:hypothetical protein [Nocardiopsis sp. Huas11]RKS05267.1 membrane protein YqaA with SNARE-associated domain [Nocardiopsis sp. Huas11]
MIQTGLAFLAALLGGLVPVVNIELYLVGAVVVDDGALAAMAVAAGLGQTLGKLPYYYVGRGTISAPWLRRKAATPGRWAARVESWRVKAQERPLWGLGLVALSSFASVPPFAVIVVLAGVVRVDVWRFCVITFVTRTARFLIVVYAPAWGLSYLPG